MIFQDLFTLKCVLKNIEIKSCCRIQQETKELFALLTGNDIVLYYCADHVPSVIRKITWFSNSSKAIQAMCFDPTATWLLVAVYDGSLYIIPALNLVDKKQKIDCKWSLNDFTQFSQCTEMIGKLPTSIVWWQTSDCNQNAIVGYKTGDLALISLTDGRCLRTYNISTSIETLLLCKDYNYLPCFCLLINGENGHQWILLLENSCLKTNWRIKTKKLNDCGSPSRFNNLRELSTSKLASIKQSIIDVATYTRKEKLNLDTNYSLPQHLSLIENTSFILQSINNVHLFSTYFKQNNVFSIYTCEMEIQPPINKFKLLPDTKYALLTEKIIFTINNECNKVSLINGTSTVCNGNQQNICENNIIMEFNNESLLAEFNLKNEKILYIFKLNNTNKTTEILIKDENFQFFNKLFDRFDIEKFLINTCVIVTDKSLYKILLNDSIIMKFIQYLIIEKNLKKSEKLAELFQLNFYELIEICGDYMISIKAFHSGIILYKQAKTHILKRVLKLALSTDCKTLLKFINLCMNVSKIDMTLPTKIHIENLTVMAYTELLLRFNGKQRQINTNEFMDFLQLEIFYDKILSVNVACQAGLWNIVILLAKCRGLQSDVVNAFGQILQTKYTPSNNFNFLLALSEPSLSQSLILSVYSREIFNYIRINLEQIPLEILNRLFIQLNPNQISIIQIIEKIFYKSSDSTDSNTLDYSTVDTDNYEQIIILIKDLIETFIHIVLYIVSKNNSLSYNINLLNRISDTTNWETNRIYDDDNNDKKANKNFNILNCGHEHAAIVRNQNLYTIGINNNGCLGHGPQINQSCSIKLVQTLINLKLNVFSVSCGRKHTLAITDCGVYAFGFNLYGQLGVGPLTRETPYPQFVPFLPRNIVQVSCGQYHSLALSDKGQVFTWGWGIHGQLGHGNCLNCFYPKKLDFDEEVIQISGGYAHSLLLTNGGNVYGFGSNVFGQLDVGNSDLKKSTKPIKIILSTENIYIIHINTKYFHNAASCVDNYVYIWGTNPQEIRLAQSSKHSTKKLEINNNKKSITVFYNFYGSNQITQICLGYSLTVFLHNNYIYWSLINDTKLLQLKSLDGGNQKFSEINCGLDYIMALDENGRLWAWGVTQSFLGKPFINERRNERKIVFSKSTKRIIKSSGCNTNDNNTMDYMPIEILGLPSININYEQSECSLTYLKSIITNNININLPYESDNILDYIEWNPSINCNDLVLHSILETYFNLYDSDVILDISLKLNNYQAASKIALLNEHYNDSFGFQLKAFKNYLDYLNLDFKLFNNCTEYILENNNKSDKSQNLLINNSIDIQSECIMTNLQNNSTDIIINNNELPSIVIKKATKIIEFYIEKVYTFDNHILMQNILMKCIEFWFDNGLPVYLLENILLKYIEKYFYPLSVVLFCKNFNENNGDNITNIFKRDNMNSSRFLKEFSTKFCLHLCSLVSANINKT